MLCHSLQCYHCLLLFNLARQAAKPGLDPINKNYKKFSGNLVKFSVFSKFLQISKLCSYKISGNFFRNLSSQLHQKILQKFFLFSRKKIVGSKFSGFPEKCNYFLENFSDLRIYVYRIKPCFHPDHTGSSKRLFVKSKILL